MLRLKKRRGNVFILDRFRPLKGSFCGRQWDISHGRQTFADINGDRPVYAGSCHHGKKLFIENCSQFARQTKRLIVSHQVRCELPFIFT